MRAALDLLTRLWRRAAAGDVAPLDALITSGFIAVDVEATGPDPERAEIIAIAAVTFAEGRLGPSLVTLVKPAAMVPGLDAAVAAAPPIAKVLPRMDALCARRIVVHHDAAFDVAILARARGPRISMAPRLVLDTQRLARALGFEEAGLDALAERLRVLDSGRPGVERTARMVGEILLALLPELRRQGVRTMRDALQLQRRATATA